MKVNHTKADCCLNVTLSKQEDFLQCRMVGNGVKGRKETFMACQHGVKLLAVLVP